MFVRPAPIALLLACSSILAAACVEPPEALAPGLLSLGHDQATPPPGWAPPMAAAVTEGPPTLYLEFDGATLDHDDSFIIPERFGQVNLPPFDAAAYGVDDREAAIDAVRARVVEHFRDTALRVVARRPTEGAYTTVMVGGFPTHIGESLGVAGIAPFDPGNRTPADIAYAFSDNIALISSGPDLGVLAAVISHEAGHTYGLDHVVAPIDLMFPQAHDRMERFTAAETLDGGWQDAPAALRRVLGGSEDGEAPGCGQDAYEPNDERARARRWSAAALEATACAGDEDWFRVDLPADFIMEVSIEHDVGAVFEPPIVYRPWGRTPLGVPFSELGRTGVRFVTEVDGVYRVQIRSDAEADAHYALVAYGEAG